MQKLLLLSVLLLGVVWAAAQNSPAGQKDSGAMAGSQTTVSGCLGGADGKYTLTDTKGNTFQLTGDTSKLADHVGHEVKITGNSSGSASSSGAMGQGGASQSLEVSSMKMVSKTCKGGAMSH